jgi:hypothetical protein
MNALIEKTLFSEPAGPLWKWRFVKLGVITVCVIVAGLGDLLRSHASLSVRYEHVLLLLFVLLIFLTTDFRWRRSIFIALRICMFVSMLLAAASLWCSVVSSSVR